jgi:uncharacterized protein YegL
MCIEQASNGPKNVIFILDTSGSMRQNNRLDLLKSAATQLVDSLTTADYMGIIQFNSDAKTFNNLNFLAPAAKSFRDVAKKYINEFEPVGRTNYEAAFKLAFKMADTSYKERYESECQTVYVFLTDGVQTEGSSEYIAQLKDRKTRVASNRNEMFIIIGLGDDVGPNTDAEMNLKKMACATEGIFESVPDVASTSSYEAKYVTEAKIMNALGAFARYFQTSSALQKRETISFTEIYEGASFPMFMTTAAQPVYDKSDPDRWKFMGVVGIDVVTCGLESEIYETNPEINDSPPWPEDVSCDLFIRLRRLCICA